MILRFTGTAFAKKSLHTMSSNSTPQHPHQTIIILGAGIIGLTTAISLAEWHQNSPKSPSFRIWTRETGAHVTSSKAGAIWEPFMANSAIVNSLANETWDHFEKEMRMHGETHSRDELGLQMLPGYMYNQPEKPDWVTEKQCWERIDEETWKCCSFLLDMDKYLPYLMKKAQDLGVHIETVTDLNHYTEIKRRVEVFQRENHTHVPFIVNATGLGSLQLFDDDEMAPVLGYTLHMKTHTGNELMNQNFYIRDEEGDGMMYVLPRTDGIVVCGGTAYFGKWDATESEDEAEKILQRIEKFAPQLEIRKVAKIHRHSIGLRPYRKSGVRIETDAQTIPELPVIHCYGMGGSGVTLSWGAANLVSRLADVLLANQEMQESNTTCLKSKL